MKTYTNRTGRWCRMHDGTVVVSNPIRIWDFDIVIYRGHRVEFDSFTSRYDGCELHRNIVDGKVYPFCHRNKGKALGAAKSIINLKVTYEVPAHQRCRLEDM